MSCKHNYKYYGIVNIFRGEELLKIYDVWRCETCGLKKVGERGPGVTSPKEGLFDEPPPGQDWFILICKRGCKLEHRFRVLLTVPF